MLDDIETANWQVGTRVFLDDETVTDDLFSVELDFGTNPYAADQLWPDVAVRNSAENGGYTGLLPRQKLAATPYALHAEMVAIGDAEAVYNSVTSADLASG